MRLLTPSSAGLSRVDPLPSSSAAGCGSLDRKLTLLLILIVQYPSVKSGEVKSLNYPWARALSSPVLPMKSSALQSHGWPRRCSMVQTMLPDSKSSIGKCLSELRVARVTSAIEVTEPSGCFCSSTTPYPHRCWCCSTRETDHSYRLRSLGWGRSS